MLPSSIGHVAISHRSSPQPLPLVIAPVWLCRRHWSSPSVIAIGHRRRASVVATMPPPSAIATMPSPLAVAIPSSQSVIAIGYHHWLSSPCCHQQRPCIARAIAIASLLCPCHRATVTVPPSPSPRTA
jgi:hypothetical protein